jgi:hypothetical protein
MWHMHSQLLLGFKELKAHNQCELKKVNQQHKGVHKCNILLILQIIKSRTANKHKTFCCHLNTLPKVAEWLV